MWPDPTRVRLRLVRVILHCRDDLGIENCRLSQRDLLYLQQRIDDLRYQNQYAIVAADVLEGAKLLNGITKSSDQLEKILSLFFRPSRLSLSHQKTMEPFLRRIFFDTDLQKKHNAEKLQGTWDYVDEVRNVLSLLSEAAKIEVTDLRRTKIKQGRPSDEVYLEFTRILIELCEDKNIKPTLSETEKKPINVSKGRYTGNLLIVAMHFEKLLPPEHRSQNIEARFNRLFNAKRAIQQGKNT